MGFERPITTNTRAPSLYPRGNPITNPLNGLLDSSTPDMQQAFDSQSRPVGYPPPMAPAPAAMPLPVAPQQRQSVWNYPSSGKGSGIMAGLLNDSVYAPMPVQPPAQVQPPVANEPGYFERFASGLGAYSRSQMPPMQAIDPLMYRAIGPVIASGGYV